MARTDIGLPSGKKTNACCFPPVSCRLRRLLRRRYGSIDADCGGESPAGGFFHLRGVCGGDRFPQLRQELVLGSTVEVSPLSPTKCKKLAEKTVKATQQITAIVSATQPDTARAVSGIGAGRGVAAKGKELRDLATQAIQSIEDEIAKTSSQTQQIATATDQTGAALEGLAINVEEIARGVEQNTAAATEVARTSQMLSAKAEELKNLVADFRV